MTGGSGTGASTSTTVGFPVLEPWEKEAIIEFHLKNPLEGYRRLTFMMLDADVVAVSSASVWRVLKQAGLLSRWKSKPSRKGTGFADSVVSSCIGICVSLCEKPMSK